MNVTKVFIALVTILLSACNGGSSSGNISDLLGDGSQRSARAYQGQVPLQIPAGKTLVVIGQGDMEQMHEYVDAAGQVPGGFMFYVQIHSDPDKLASRLASFSDFLALYPNAIPQIGLTLGPSPVWDTLAGNPSGPGAVMVSAGDYDEQLGMLANWLNSLSTVAHLRIGYEFDLLGGQWGPPGVFQDGYRHVVDYLRAEGVDNAVYIWHSAGAFFRGFDDSGPIGLLGSASPADGSGDTLLSAVIEAFTAVGDGIGNNSDLLPIGDFYPGDDYVDYFAISFWGDTCCFGESSPEAKQAYLDRTKEIIRDAQDLGEPIMLGEATPPYIGMTSGQKSLDWMNTHFDLVEEFDIRAIAYINLDWPRDSDTWSQPFWGGFWPDSRVQVSPETHALWEDRLSLPRYQPHSR